MSFLWHTLACIEVNNTRGLFARIKSRAEQGDIPLYFTCQSHSQSKSTSKHYSRLLPWVHSRKRKTCMNEKTIPGSKVQWSCSFLSQLYNAHKLLCRKMHSLYQEKGNQGDVIMGKENFFLM